VFLFRGEKRRGRGEREKRGKVSPSLSLSSFPSSFRKKTKKTFFKKKLLSPRRDRRRDQPEPEQRHQLVGAPVRLLPPDQRRLDEAQGQLRVCRGGGRGVLRGGKKSERGRRGGRGEKGKPRASHPASHAKKQRKKDSYHRRVENLPGVLDLRVLGVLSGGTMERRLLRRVFGFLKSEGKVRREEVEKRERTSSDGKRDRCFFCSLLLSALSPPPNQSPVVFLDQR
jgi:hypothetical protein